METTNTVAAFDLDALFAGFAADAKKREEEREQRLANDRKPVEGRAKYYCTAENVEEYVDGLNRLCVAATKIGAKLTIDFHLNKSRIVFYYGNGIMHWYDEQFEIIAEYIRTFHHN